MSPEWYALGAWQEQMQIFFEECTRFKESQMIFPEKITYIHTRKQVTMSENHENNK